MKIGSLVECIKSCRDVGRGCESISLPTVGEIFTVIDIYREVDFYSGIGLEFEELKGYGADAECFKELQPPMDLSFIQELQITQPLTA